MVPAARLSAYLNRRIGAIATLLMVAAVASEDPETAANPAQAPIVAMARPPRRCPSHALVAS